MLQCKLACLRGSDIADGPPFTFGGLLCARGMRAACARYAPASGPNVSRKHTIGLQARTYDDLGPKYLIMMMMMMMMVVVMMIMIMFTTAYQASMSSRPPFSLPGFPDLPYQFCNPLLMHINRFFRSSANSRSTFCNFHKDSFGYSQILKTHLSVFTRIISVTRKH